MKRPPQTAADMAKTADTTTPAGQPSIHQPTTTSDKQQRKVAADKQQRKGAEAFLNHWERAINHEAFKVWRASRPASCDWQDIAQEVRLVLLEREIYTLKPNHIASYIKKSIRNEARKALQRGCKDEQNLDITYIEDNPRAQNICYSTGGNVSDNHID